MVPKINGLGRSFVGVAAYCLHRAPEPDDRSPETSEREQGRIRCEARAKNNARRRAGEEVVRIPWNRPLHWARFRHEGMQPGRARRATPPGGEERVDMTVWRRAEAQLWENAEDRRWLEFWRLESRARKEWAELHKRREDIRQTLDRESRTVLGRLRIWRTDRSLRDLAGAVRGHRQRPADRAAGARGLPKRAAGLGAARTADPAGPRRQGRRAGGAGDEAAGALSEHHPHSAPAPRPLAWRGRVRAMTLDVGIAM
ncbi:hypothetical protein [Candidatus Palauibacter sp.]|uniref:hypothetical protein n=1 Tax=Candidatus Palauibacter sp. TaxID=3101350 RepID=UPI003B5CD0A7